MLHTCEGPGCDVTFEAKTKRAKYHSRACSVAASRAGLTRKVVDLDSRRSEVVDEGSPGSQERATLVELESIEQVESSLGASALALARRIDRDQDTGTAMASMVGRLALVMVAARASGAAPAGSHTDEVRRKREEWRARGA